MRPQRFCFPQSRGSFRFRLPPASPPRGTRPANRRPDGHCVPAAVAMAQAAALAEVTQVLCAAGGALELGKLRRRLRNGVGADALERLLRESGRFVVATRADAGGAAAVPERVVLAASALRLCRGHQGLKATCTGLCGQLHLCKFMVLGACKFLKTG